MDISIIIPCYNEKDRIRPTLEAIHAYVLRHSDKTFEVIVVDNGSKDGTRDIIESMKTHMPELRMLEKNSYGKGWAVKQGMLEATGDYRLFTDADNSTDISHLDLLMEYARNGFDVVISSRRAAGAKIVHPQPWYRRVLGNIFAGIVRFIVPLHILDTQNGFKLFSKAAAEKIFPRQAVYFWAFDIEVLALAKRFGFKIKEVPIRWVNDEGSKMTLKGMARMLLEVAYIRMMLFAKK